MPQICCSNVEVTEEQRMHGISRRGGGRRKGGSWLRIGCYVMVMKEQREQTLTQYCGGGRRAGLGQGGGERRVVGGVGGGHWQPIDGEKGAKGADHGMVLRGGG